MNIPCPYCSSNDTNAVFSIYSKNKNITENRNIIHGTLKCNLCHQYFAVEKDYENKTIKVNNCFLKWRKNEKI